MKLSILTATYNRAELLKRLYNSIEENLEEVLKYNDELIEKENAKIDIFSKDYDSYEDFEKYKFEVEWYIMDDGSEDYTEKLVQDLSHKSTFQIKYFNQVNQGKMIALNNLMDYVRSDLCIEIDSDDWLSNNAFINIEKAYQECKYRQDLYALAFLKKDQNGNNLGKNFPSKENTMYNLYFKDLEDGEKALVFFTDIRKKYHYKIEKGEKFSTEARMYHEMDKKYHMMCYNEYVEICEYQQEGYTKNIKKQFKKNPKGYLKYFEEILENHDVSKLPKEKRNYVIKHYILFCALNNKFPKLGKVKGFLNKLLIAILYFPGAIKTWIDFRDKKEDVKRLEAPKDN